MKPLKSTEIIHSDGTVTAGVDLPEAVTYHAITIVNETVSILTTGYGTSDFDGECSKIVLCIGLLSI